jgi:8-oxo-dGTP pyrophosphatase MutT (NUDIX family)
MLLTVRDAGLPTHAGQVAFPGGAVEDGETVESAALREAEEEVGVSRGGVRVLGELTPLHVPVSGFVLHPVVGVADTRPDLSPRPGAVRRILEPSIADLRGSIGSERRSRDGETYHVPYFGIAGEKVWGATAMVLGEFLALVGLPPRAIGQGEP